MAITRSRKRFFQGNHKLEIDLLQGEGKKGVFDRVFHHFSLPEANFCFSLMVCCNSPAQGPAGYLEHSDKNGSMFSEAAAVAVFPYHPAATAALAAAIVAAACCATVAADVVVVVVAAGDVGDISSAKSVLTISDSSICSGFGVRRSTKRAKMK